MAYSIQRITTIDSNVLRRLFNHCEAKATDNYTDLDGKTSDEKFEVLLGAANQWSHNANKGMCLECSKDGFVVFMSWGPLIDQNWKVINFLAGRDYGGSRSYLYDTDWLIAMRDFHLTMTDVYTSHEVIHTPDKSAKTHFDAMINTANSDARFNHNVSNDETVDTNFKSRKIKDIT
jgi:hypothetical protein